MPMARAIAFSDTDPAPPAPTWSPARVLISASVCCRCRSRRVGAVRLSTLISDHPSLSEWLTHYTLATKLQVFTFQYPFTEFEERHDHEHRIAAGQQGPAQRRPAR